MDIVKQTSTKLKLHSSGLEAWIIGGVILTVGILIPPLFSGKTIDTFTCNRVDTNQGSCEIQEMTRWGKSKPKIIPLHELKGAEVEDHVTYDKKGREHTSYRVYIISNIYEDIYFIGDYDREYPDSVAGQINEFVSDSTKPSLKIISEGDNSLFMYIVGGVIGFISLFFIFVDDVICTFDKSNGCFYIRRRGLRGNRFKSGRNHDVSDIQITEASRVSNKQTGKTHVTYNLNLVLNSGESLLLTNGSKIEEYKKITDSIRQIINLR